MERTKIEIAQREKREQQLKGRKGKGHIKNYKLFCRKCHTEYLVDDIFECTHCGNKDLETYEERYEELKEKLEEHKLKV